MKKRILAAVLCVSMIGLMLMGCANTRDDGTIKVGITIQSLSNAYWAGVMGKLEKQMDAKGWDYTIVDCENNAGTQVGQVENFIISGCDLIMVHPADAKSLEGICSEAMEVLGRSDGEHHGELGSEQYGAWKRDWQDGGRVHQ